MNELIDLLNTAFANNFTFYQKAHSYHWSVTGPDFPQYHKFLEEVYSNSQGLIDGYGEQLRKLGVFPDMSAISDMASIAAIADPVTDPQQIFTNLLNDIDTIITGLQDTFDAATSQREYGLQNFVADQIDTHKQQAWMINAILGQTP